MTPKSVANHNPIPVEIDVFYSQRRALREPHTRSIQDGHHQTLAAGQTAQYELYVLTREYHRKQGRPYGAHDFIQPAERLPVNLTIKEKQALSAWFCVDALTRPSVAR